MSITNNFEDEEVTLENSPLQQYLNDIHFDDNDDECISMKIQENVGSNISSQFKFMFIRKVISAISFLRKYSLNKNYTFLLSHALEISVLNEEDEMALKYLIDTRKNHQDINKTDANCPPKVPSMVIMFIAFISMIFIDKLVIFATLMSLCLLWLSLLSLYSYFVRRAILSMFDNIVTISRQSRQMILTVQELLSINQGYSRVVHIKEDERYDCSKSFNVKFLHNLIEEIFSVLSKSYSQSQRWNHNLEDKCGNRLNCPREISWLQEEITIGQDELLPSDLDLDHPITGLKNLHNHIQSQFSFSIKKIALWLSSADCHPDIGVPRTILSINRQSSRIISDLNRCIKVLQYKTRSNLTEKSRSNKKIPQSDLQKQFISNFLRSMRLHLFEISEFSSQFLEEVERDSLEKSFQRSLSGLQRCRMHIDGLYSCWASMTSEVDNLTRKRLDPNSSSKISQGNCERGNLEKESKELPLVEDEEIEIVDEVLEGVPVEGDFNETGERILSDLDTFEEKSKRNANSLLNELKSVIEVRAEDWKKREKVALERRAAEGKFVFGEGEEVLTRSIGEVASVDEGLPFGYGGFDGSLSEMILRQRRAMFLQANVDLEDEECFSD